MRILALSVAGAALAGVMGAAQAQVAYDLNVTTFYQFGAPGDLAAGPGGAPDTGFARFTNTGTSTFSGTFKLQGTDSGGTFWETTFTVASLGAGASFGSMSINNESSNFGGFNKLPGATDLGVLLSFTGTVFDGVNTEAVALSVYDRDVHSGVFRDPFGDHASDSYVLQGGDAFGRDTGDDFEVSQAPGSYNWHQVPTPGSLALAGVVGLAGLRRRR